MSQAATSPATNELALLGIKEPDLANEIDWEAARMCIEALNLVLSGEAQAFEARVHCYSGDVVEMKSIAGAETQEKEAANVAVFFARRANKILSNQQ
jgi:hypothetical protein